MARSLKGRPQGKLSARRQKKKGEFLIFGLANGEYGLGVLHIRKIITYTEVIAIPKTPAHVKGVINLQDEVVPVVDLRSRLGLGPAEATDQTCIIIVEVVQSNGKCSAGIIVDSVSEVLQIPEKDIEPVPQFGATAHADFVSGINKTHDSVRVLLDIDKVLAETDLGSLK